MFEFEFEGEERGAAVLSCACGTVRDGSLKSQRRNGFRALNASLHRVVPKKDDYEGGVPTK